jgi:hypothetical protein
VSIAQSVPTSSVKGIQPSFLQPYFAKHDSWDRTSLVQTPDFQQPSPKIYRPTAPSCAMRLSPWESAGARQPRQLLSHGSYVVVQHCGGSESSPRMHQLIHVSIYMGRGRVPVQLAMSLPISETRDNASSVASVARAREGGLSTLSIQVAAHFSPLWSRSSACAPVKLFRPCPAVLLSLMLFA